LKDWTLADDLRRKIEAEGWVVKDGKDGFELEER
jgi:cysteinyl-tRNA synthetase